MKNFFLLLLLVFTFLAKAQEPKLMLPIGHAQGVREASFSPDGKFVVSRSYNDGNAKVWDTRTGKLIYNFTQRTTVSDMQFTADSRGLIVTNDNEGSIWNLQSGNQLGSFQVDSSLAFSSIAVTKRSGLFYTAVNNTLKTWDMKGNLQQSSLFDADVFKVVPGPTDSTLLVVTKDSQQLSSLIIFDPVANRQRTVISKRKFSTVFSDNHFALLFSNGTAHLYNRKSLQRLKQFNIRKGKLTCFSLSRGGDKLLLGYDDISLRAYHTKSGKQILSLSFDDAPLLNLEFIGNGESFILYDEFYKAYQFATATGKYLYTFEGDSASKVNRSVGSFIASSTDRKQVMMVFEDNIIRTWNVAGKPKLQQLFYGRTAGLNVRARSPQTPHLATGNQAGEIKVFNFKTGAVDLILEDRFEIVDLKFSDDSKLLVAASDSTCRIWAFPSGQLLQTLSHNSFVQKIDISTDGKYIITSASPFSADHPMDTAVRIWDWQTATVIKAIPAKKTHRFFNVFFGANDSLLLATNPGDSTIRLLDAQTLDEKWRYKAGDWLEHSAFFNNNQAIISLTANSVDIIDIAAAKRAKSFPVDNTFGGADYTVSKDGRFMVTGERGLIKKWDLSSGRLLQAIQAHTSGIYPELIFNDSLLISPSEDGTIKIWSFPEMAYRYHILPLKDEYFTQLASGYFYSSPGAARLVHYVAPGPNVISFEQLDVKFNRPDLVLQTIGVSDTALITSYRKAYEKRIRKVGIDTTTFGGSFGLPEADIENRNSIAYEQRSEKLLLRIRGTDSAYHLDRFNIWINEVPLFGMRGISLKSRKTNVLDTTLTVTLSQGTNMIETSVTNVNGTESYRMPLTVLYAPVAAPKETLHFIGIGIDRFADSRQNLNYSVKDVRDLALRLKTKYGKRVSIDTFFNEAVTVAAIAALKTKLLSTSVNDKVILSYSGHGLLSTAYDYFLSTYNVNFSKPEENGLPYDLLEGLLDSIPARKKLMLIDACHSGEVDKEEMQKYKVVLTEKAGDGLKGLGIENTDSTAKVGMKSSFELMQELFVNVGKSTGATIISAAAGTQLAQERGELKNGVFTYAILEYMKNHSAATVSELKNYVNKRVPELTGGLQVPTTRTETKQVNWQVW